MRRITIFDQRAIFEKVNRIFDLIKRYETQEPFLIWVYIERAISYEHDDFFLQLDKLNAQEIVKPAIIQALANLNTLFLSLNTVTSNELIKNIKQRVERNIQYLRETDHSKFDEAKAKACQIDTEVKTDSSWRNPSLETPVRTHTPFSSGEDEESGKNLTK